MEEVIAEKRPCLLLCMPTDDDFSSQLKIMEVMARRHESWLKAGLLGDAFVEYFKKKLSVTGTPTFLIFFDGKELNRMLGMLDYKSLEHFVLDVIEASAKDSRRE
ncbi:thioredoxin [bacterium]|nr:thioredoxin [bacterium]